MLRIWLLVPGDLTPLTYQTKRIFSYQDLFIGRNDQDFNLWIIGTYRDLLIAADCPPVLFYDPVKQVVGNIHVGWRGLLQGIIFNAVEIFKIKYNFRTENINVFIGPGIGSCHFEVGDDVAGRFIEDYKDFITENNNKKQIDLKGIIRFILLTNGFKNDNIDVSPDCTFCRDDLYSSYRREWENLKAMGAVIGIRWKCKKINHLSFWATLTTMIFNKKRVLFYKDY